MHNTTFEVGGGTASLLQTRSSTTTRERKPSSTNDFEAKIDPGLTEPDIVLLHNLIRDIEVDGSWANNTADIALEHNDSATEEKLANLKKRPEVFCTWEYKDLPIGKGLIGNLLERYVGWAQTVVRNPVDVIFLTHILLYLGTSIPSATYLYFHFSWMHAIIHLVMQGYYLGSFNLMLHNCIHNNGLLASNYAWADQIWPYVLEPLMGHTWNSYYYHHVKHHHVENNGPDDLSSTIRYQRDEFSHFLMYLGRFLTLVWVELPIYFYSKNKFGLAIKAAISEFGSYLFFYLMSRYNLRATIFVFLLPFCVLRIGLMIGNFGQHAFVDEIDPDSDFRSSITLIDVPSNRFCFNDGYHTSHHLNPRRHWKDHPAAFLKAKKQYQEGQALVFYNIDFLMITYRLLRKQYLELADCMIPIGSQVSLTREERAELLRTKARRFTEEEIRQKFRGRKH